MFQRFLIIFFLLACVSCASTNAKLSHLDSVSRAEYKRNVEQFIEDMNAKHGFDKEYLRQLFDTVAPISVARSISQNDAVSFEQPNWRAYRDKMINDYRIQQGVLYYAENKETLNSAENEFGVPSHILVGIIGIETNYGRIRMPYKAIDALTTLSFLSTRRGEYFKTELESFLLLTQKKELEPTALMGSYAGAIGIPQFMPSNVSRYGVDGNNDGIIDIINSHADAIFSIANYLSKHGWKINEPVSLKVAFTGRSSMIDNYVSDSACSGSMITIATLIKAGFVIPKININKGAKVRLFKLYIGGDSYEYHIAFDNLCVLMKYNRSIRYAMAVNYLGVNVFNKSGISLKSSQLQEKNISSKAKKISKKSTTKSKKTTADKTKTQKNTTSSK